MIVIILPGGFEQFFAAVDAHATAGSPPLEEVMQLAAQYGVAIVGPPLGAEASAWQGEHER